MWCRSRGCRHRENCHEPVGDAGRDAAEKVVAAMFAPAADDVVALFKLGEEVGDLVGIVLKSPSMARMKSPWE